MTHRSFDLLGSVYLDQIRPQFWPSMFRSAVDHGTPFVLFLKSTVVAAVNTYVQMCKNLCCLLLVACSCVFRATHSGVHTYEASYVEGVVLCHSVCLIGLIVLCC